MQNDSNPKHRKVFNYYKYIIIMFSLATVAMLAAITAISTSVVGYHSASNDVRGYSSWDADSLKRDSYVEDVEAYDGFIQKVYAGASIYTIENENTAYQNYSVCRMTPIDRHTAVTSQNCDVANNEEVKLVGGSLETETNGVIGKVDRISDRSLVIIHMNSTVLGSTEGFTSTVETAKNPTKSTTYSGNKGAVLKAFSRDSGEVNVIMDSEINGDSARIVSSLHKEDNGAPIFDKNGVLVGVYNHSFSNEKTNIGEINFINEKVDKYAAKL